MTTADKLITVAENVPKVYHAGQLNVIENTSTLKKSASGFAFLIDDISPVTHDMGVKVRGKNLFDINGFINLTGNSTYYGINDNGELYVKQSDFRDDTTIPAFITLEAGTYTLCSTTPITSNFKLINLTDNTVISFNNNITFSIEKVTSLGIKCYQSADTVMGKLQLELGTTATAYTPYIPDLTAVKVKRCGKNLFDINTAEKVNGAATLEKQDDKIVVGETGTWTYCSANISLPTYLVGKTITLSAKAKTSGSNNAQLRIQWVTEAGGAAGDMILSETCTGETETLLTVSGVVPNQYDSSHTILALMLYSNSDATLESGTYTATYSDIQIELGSSATEYEIGATPTEYTPNSDGTVDGVSSLYPNTTLATDTDGVIIDCEYYKDIDVNEVVTRTVTSYSNPKIKVIGNSAFYGYSALTAVNFPVATSIGDDAFGECESLTTINFPVATSIGNYAFEYCYALTAVNFPAVTSIGNSAFYECSALTAVNFPAVTSIGNCAFYECSALTAVNFPAVTSIGRRAFDNCTSLTTADFTVATNIGNSAFNYCPALTALILRNSTICSLSSTNAFNLCTLITGTGGYIYVPSSLINAYKTATNWVTYASKFRALEDYTVDGTTTGALDESKVSA